MTDDIRLLELRVQYATAIREHKSLYEQRDVLAAQLADRDRQIAELRDRFEVEVAQQVDMGTRELREQLAERDRRIAELETLAKERLDELSGVWRHVRTAQTQLKQTTERLDALLVAAKGARRFVGMVGIGEDDARNALDAAIAQAERKEEGGGV